MFFRFSAETIGGGVHDNILQRLIYPFFPKKWPPRRGGGVLPDSISRGTNYLHTSLLKKYPKSNFLHCKACYSDSAPGK